MTIARCFNIGIIPFVIAKVLQGRLNNCMSYISSYFHCIFSTKEWRPLITPELSERLWPFLGGIARQNKMKAIEIGGVADHERVEDLIAWLKSAEQNLEITLPGERGWQTREDYLANGIPIHAEIVAQLEMVGVRLDSF